MQTSYGSSEADQSTMQLVIDQIEELIVAVIEEVRQRPGVAVAILAAVVGAIVGSALAARRVRAKPVPKKQIETAFDMGDLGAGITKLLNNPIVRSFLFAMVTRVVRKRVGF
jgi:hypothetical protein